MTRPYRLAPSAPVPPRHPLHWARFWPDLQRVHRAQAEARQDLVLWLASLWRGATRPGHPLGFSTVQLRLTDLRDHVRDYRPALDHFFTVQQLGYHLRDERSELTTLVPKALEGPEQVEVETTTATLRYAPPPLPEGTVISKVHLQPGLRLDVLAARTMAAGRHELIPPLTWLLTQPARELNFHFQRAGRLQQRDTSVWPITAIETWPGWLREALFGPGIDLDSAYVQFLLHHLRAALSDRPGLLELLFPDLLRLLHDKEAFREELCTQVLQRPYTEHYRGVIKQVLMALANGSRISPALLTNGGGYSLTAELIIDAAPEASVTDLTLVGERLKRIADQFAAARRQACAGLLRRAPSRRNVKQVFSAYFTWERQARYALWEACDRHGLMVHDGLDGVPDRYRGQINALIENLDLRLTA